MITSQCIPLDSPDQWSKALNGIRHSFAQTWENCYAMHLTTGYKTCLYLFEKENIRIVCPIAERPYNGYIDIVSPYGFSGFAGNEDCREFQDYWQDFVRKKGYVCGYISLNPVLTNKTYYKKEDAYQSTSLYFLDLTLSLTDLFDNLDANRRKEIKNFRKAEANFIYDRKLLTCFLLNNYYDFLKRINASPANYFSKNTLEYICSLENTFMVGAGRRDKIDAVYIFAYTPYMGDCLFNVANTEGRVYSSLLLWAGIKFLRSKKIPLVNLGGGTAEDDNVARAKQRFGAFRMPFTNLKQVYDYEIYEKLCSMNGVEANDKTGYFPAYRKLN